MELVVGSKKKMPGTTSCRSGKVCRGAIGNCEVWGCSEKRVIRQNNVAARFPSLRDTPSLKACHPLPCKIRVPHPAVQARCVAERSETVMHGSVQKNALFVRTTWQHDFPSLHDTPSLKACHPLPLQKPGTTSCRSGKVCRGAIGNCDVWGCSEKRAIRENNVAAQFPIAARHAFFEARHPLPCKIRVPHPAVQARCVAERSETVMHGSVQKNALFVRTTWQHNFPSLRDTPSLKACHPLPFLATEVFSVQLSGSIQKNQTTHSKKENDYEMAHQF
ncbi:MAG: hypothetical protein R3C59_13510 [Planctomycetaceae bacterium]